MCKFAKCVNLQNVKSCKICKVCKFAKCANLQNELALRQIFSSYLFRGPGETDKDELSRHSLYRIL